MKEIECLERNIKTVLKRGDVVSNEKNERTMMFKVTGEEDIKADVVLNHVYRH